MVAKKKLKAVWSIKASKSLEYYYKRIKKDSVTNANKVRSEIFKTSKALPANPVQQVKERSDSAPNLL